MKSQSNDAFEYNDQGLEKFFQMLKDKMPYAKVGILGNSEARINVDTETGEILGNATNAEIGLKHEFGGTTVLPNGVSFDLPQRSFLRVPIIENFQKFINQHGAFDRVTFRSIIKEGNFTKWLVKIGTVGEYVVQDAFETGGDGAWPVSNMAYKNNHQTLVESQQLRNSIWSEVVE